MAYWTDRAGGGADRAPNEPNEPDALTVVIPAHNEAASIGRCLASVRRSAATLARRCPNPPEVRIVVVLDSCTDGTADAVVAAGVRVVLVDHRRAGAARRSGAELALVSATGGSDWIASTDADSTVPVGWLTSMVRLARGGADLVVGTVQPDATLPPDTRHRWRSSYHGRDGHPHVHAANLGIRVDAYRSVGGWPPVACHEDVLLVTRAVDAGLTVVRTGAITVTTSGRLTGRAPDGFAAHLATLTSR